MTTEVKKKFILFYYQEIRAPLNAAKREDLKALENRADLKNQIVKTDDLTKAEISEFVGGLWSGDGDKAGAFNEVNQYLTKIEAKLSKFLMKTEGVKPNQKSYYQYLLSKNFPIFNKKNPGSKNEGSVANSRYGNRTGGQSRGNNKGATIYDSSEGLTDINSNEFR